MDPREALKLVTLNPAIQLGVSDRRQVFDDLRPVHRRVEDVTLFAPGGYHEGAMNLVVGVQGDGARSLRALIIGMGVDCKQPAIHGEEYPTAWNQLGVGYVQLRSPR